MINLKHFTKLAFIITLVSALQIQNAHAQKKAKKASKSVTAAIELLRKAMVDADSVQLSALTAPQLSYGHSSGKVQTKQEFIHSLTTGESDFVTLTFSNQTVQITGHTAIVRHVLAASTNDGGKPGSVKLNILLVWVKQKSGGWQLVARQAVKPPVS